MAISDFNNIFTGDQFSFDYDNMSSTSPLKTMLASGTIPSYEPYGGAVGVTGATLSTTLNSTSNVTWTNSTITATASPYTVSVTGDSFGYANAWGYNKTLKVDGDAEFNGDLKVGGVSLTERLDDIEKRLAILRPNNDLEGKWEKLKELGEQYRQLEQEILEKEKVWDILKK